MKVTYLPEDGKKFIPYEVMGKIVSFNDGDLMFDVSKKERDYKVVIDICQDYTGGLVMGASQGERYVAQLVVPARKYTESTEANPNYDPEAETESMESPTITTRDAVPFDIDKCELRLWEMEV
jgi:hypothetical protein|nr:MAG TPA: hypothetical protein [Caudoviricetes sp.]